MPDKDNKDQSLLTEFLQSLEKVPVQIIEALMKEATDEDEKNVIKSYASSFTTQFKEVSKYLQESSATASKQSIMNTEQFLRVSDGNGLAQNLKIALPSIGSIIGKMGILGIIQELKKIITKIFEFLGKKIPAWLDIVMLLINEILDHLLGGESIKMRTALSQMEQNYLSELTQFAKLEKASQFKFQDEDEDED